MNVKWKLFISSGSTQSSYKKLITVEIRIQSGWWDYWENGESVISHTSRPENGESVVYHTSSAWEWRIRCLPYLLSPFSYHPTTRRTPNPGLLKSQHATPIPSLPILSNPNLHSTATLVMHNHRVPSLTVTTATPSVFYHNSSPNLQPTFTLSNVTPHDWA